MSIKRVKIEFEPGCFDGLDITQEQLDAIVERIQQLALQGQIAHSGAYDLEGQLVDADLERTTVRPQRLH